MAAGEVVDDVTGGIPDHVRVQRVRRVVLVVEEHEGIAVAVGVGDLPARELDFLQLVVAAEAEVELGAARHAVHGEAELDVAAAALR